MAAIVYTEGLTFFGETALSEAQSVPASFYLGLGTGALPTLAQGLADITEVSGTGYARQAIASNNTDIVTSADGNYMKFTCSEETFTGGAGGWTEADYAFLCTVSSGTSGKLLAAVDLSTPQTLGENDLLKVTFAVEFGPD